MQQAGDGDGSGGTPVTVMPDAAVQLLGAINQQLGQVQNLIANPDDPNYIAVSAISVSVNALIQGQQGS